MNMPYKKTYPLYALGQYFTDSRHDIISAGQSDGVSQGAVTLYPADLPPVRAVLRPAVRQAHEPFALQLRRKPDAAAHGIILIPEGKRGHPTR